MNLSMLKPGEKGEIIKIGAGGLLKRRLMDMGLLVGEEVRVEKTAPLGDPIEVIIKNYSLSLRKREAKYILVEAMNGQQAISNYHLTSKSRHSTQQSITVAVAGNPNSGKSTLINAITGMKLHVGNWPGVTIEKREAILNYKGKRITLADLPGTYSLSPYTQEEIIARDFLVYERPDVIVDVVDSTNLERNLYLTVQLMELEIPVIVALNIYDEAENKGYEIDIKAMENILGILAITTVATRKKGLANLLNAVVDTVDNQSVQRLKELNYGDDIESVARLVEEQVKSDYPSLLEKHKPRWLAFKLMEGDKHVLNEVSINGNVVHEAVSQLTTAHGDDIESIMADARYAQAVELTRKVLKKPEKRRVELTEKIDKIALNRFLGIPIFLTAMWLVFKLTFDLSTPFVDWVDVMTTGPLSRWAEYILHLAFAPDWVISLCTEGVIAGVGFVLVFVPVIFAMMFFITFLEGSGYMARAAFVMDRAMHIMGLHGKSFIPMLLGFGCNVPAVYATRTLENKADKILTALLVPLMSCGARLPVYVLFAGVFFSDHSGTVLWSLYVMGIVLAVCVGMLFRKTLFKEEVTMFIMELPPYRMPSLRSLIIHTWEKGKHFLMKAGTYIFAISILVWFSLNIPWGVEQKKDSLLGMTGQVIAPIFKPLGFGSWEASSSLVTGIIAKEIVVGTMGEIYTSKREKIREEKPPTLTEDLKEAGLSFAEAVKTSLLNVFSTFRISSISTEEIKEHSGLRLEIHDAFTPLRAYSFMAFVLLYTPCIVTAVAYRQEFGTWKWFGIAFAYEFILAWVVAFAIFQGGSLLGMQ